MKRPITKISVGGYVSPQIDYFLSPVEQGFSLTDNANAGYEDNELEDLE